MSLTVFLRKMIIAPIIFCTVVSGIAHVSDAAKVGRVALKAGLRAGDVLVD